MKDFRKVNKQLLFEITSFSTDSKAQYMHVELQYTCGCCTCHLFIHHFPETHCMRNIACASPKTIILNSSMSYMCKHVHYSLRGKKRQKLELFSSDWENKTAW